MPYSKCRLAEALQIIRDETRHRNEVEAAKLLETQYRDDFHLRKPSSTRKSQIHGWPDSYDAEEVRTLNAPKRKRRCTPDSDYGENGEKPKRKKNKRIDESRTFGSCSTSSAICHIDKRKKKNTPMVEASPTTASVTFRLSAERGRDFPHQKVKEHPGMNSNMYNIITKHKLSRDLSSWRSNRGGPQRADRTPLGLDKDFLASKNQPNIDDTDTPDLSIAGKLRNGKERAAITPKNRKRRNNDDDQDEDLVVHKLRKTDCQTPDCSLQSFSDVVKPPNCEANSHALLIPSSGAYDDAISIASSCEDNNGDTTQPMPSRPLALTNNQSYVHQPAPGCPPTPESLPPSQLCFHIPRERDCERNLAQSSKINQITIKTLTTHFSHPINFRTLNPSDCTFHQDYRHPLFGHGEITAQYIVYPDRPGHLEESGDGHLAKNKAVDCMCVKCALDYMQTIRCPRHTFSSIPLTPKRTQILGGDGLAYLNDMFRVRRSDPFRNLKALVEICSLCPAPATMRCSAVQIRNSVGYPCRLPNESVEAAKARIERNSSRRSTGVNVNGNSSLINEERSSISITSIQPPLYGCGLHLCGACYKLINDECHGNMQQNRDFIMRELKGRGLPARADVEFRFQEGLLYKAWAGGGEGKVRH